MMEFFEFQAAVHSAIASQLADKIRDFEVVYCPHNAGHEAPVGPYTAFTFRGTTAYLYPSPRQDVGDIGLAAGKIVSQWRVES